MIGVFYERYQTLKSLVFFVGMFLMNFVPIREKIEYNISWKKMVIILGWHCKQVIFLQIA